jgi:hypothetical protein
MALVIARMFTCSKGCFVGAVRIEVRVLEHTDVELCNVSMPHNFIIRGRSEITYRTASLTSLASSALLNLLYHSKQ